MSTLITGKGAACIDLVARANAGTLGSLLNPEGVALIVTRCVVYVGTQTTDGGTTLNVGHGSTSTTDNASLHSALALDGTDGTAYNGFNSANAADAMVVWPATEYLTCTSSAAATAFVGKVYVEYIRAA